jgi:pyridinium-3,5-bisthiocarboxylic acid mononucleotide nickel chelatase
MQALYLDCFSGISGDMLLGALVDLGVPLARLRAGLKRLPVAGYRIGAAPVRRGRLGGTRVRVEVAGRQPRRTPDGIRRLIDRSGLPARVRQQALRAFEVLVAAEARVHRIPAARVHLHEVGAVDAIVDIVGAMIGLEALGWPRVVCSPLHVGSGMVRMEHGTFPIPGPATAEILRGRPTYATHVDGELVTPTGATLAVTLAESFGPLPSMRVRRIGYGAGSREIPDHPNLLRLLLGDLVDAAAVRETVLVVETTIDDLTPQIYGHLMDRLFDAGALEVFYTPIQMKKNRPGTKVTVILPEFRLEEISRVIFRETTTIGFRYLPMGRIELSRTMETVRTPYGPVRMKISYHNGEEVQATPEYEDCRTLSLRTGVALKEIQRAAWTARLDTRRAGRGAAGARRTVRRVGRRASRGTGHRRTGRGKGR